MARRATASNAPPYVLSETIYESFWVVRYLSFSSFPLEYRLGPNDWFCYWVKRPAYFDKPTLEMGPACKRIIFLILLTVHPSLI